MTTQQYTTHYKILFVLFGILLTVQAAFSQISIGLIGCYHATKEEKEATPSQQDLLVYEKLKTSEVQSYINKLIISTDSKKYFSFILADLTETVEQKIDRDKDFTIVEKSISKAPNTTYYFYKIKEASGLLTIKILYKQPELTNSILVDVLVKNETAWHSFYQNKNAFIKKLDCATKK